MKKLFVVLTIVAVIFAGYLYLFRPHITLQEVRISNNPETVKAVYVNVTGDPLCAKLYRLGGTDNNKLEASKEPLFLALPNSIPSPEDGKLAYSDNVFIIKGYRYQFVQNNKLTGESKFTPSHSFDVVAWEVMAPYKIWKKMSSTGGSAIEAETRTEPVSHQFDNTDHDPNQFTKGNYVDCLR
ncbi:MAG: hypothetical protein ACYSUB_21940 [Planctomycetota bacterium]